MYRTLYFFPFGEIGVFLRGSLCNCIIVFYQQETIYANSNSVKTGLSFVILLIPIIEYPITFPSSFTLSKTNSLSVSLVYPGAGLPLLAKSYGAYVVEVNPNRTSVADLHLQGPSGVVLTKVLDELRNT